MVKSKNDRNLLIFLSSVSLDCDLCEFSKPFFLLTGALMNALGAIALGAPIGMQYVSFFVVWTFQNYGQG